MTEIFFVSFFITNTNVKFVFFENMFILFLSPSYDASPWIKILYLSPDTQ